MHKSNYIEIAAIIRSARNEHGDNAAVRDIESELTSYFARDNELFSRTAFAKACEAKA